MSNQINFTDENGKILPLEDIQKVVSEKYNSFIDNNQESFLDRLTNPDFQINTEQTIETLNFLNRTLYLYDEITPDSAILFSEAIRFWNQIDDMDGVTPENRDPIKIYINSPGGDLDATFSIIDSISLSKTPIWTITIGTGCSGGFFIGIAGHKRIGYPHSSYLFHEGSAQGGGDAHKYLQEVKFYEKKLSMLKKITLKYTKITEEDYKKHRKDDLWLTSNEALNFGIIDEIATSLV